MQTIDVKGPAKYGKYYWYVVCGDHRYAVHADKMEVTASGALVAVCHQADGQTPLNGIAFAPGEWQRFHAASCMDGSAIVVDHILKDGKVVYEASFS